MRHMLNQLHLDVKAKTHGYDSILSATTFATFTNSHHEAEGQACIKWRDAVWSAEFESMKGNPTIDMLIASLPKIDWPILIASKTEKTYK